MASTAVFSPIPHPKIRKPRKLDHRKPQTTLPFLFTSNPSPQFHTSSIPRAAISSSSFRHNFYSPSPSSNSAAQCHALPLSPTSNSIETLRDSSSIQMEEPIPRIFVQEPPWISSFLFQDWCERNKRNGQNVKLEFRETERRNYGLLRRRQVRAETEAWERMVEEYREIEREMCEKKLAPNLPYVKALFLGWFEPLREAIEKEQRAQRTKKQKVAFAPHIELLPADKMAVIVMHKMMALVMVGHEEGCVRVVQAAVQIGMAIEQEVRIQNFLEKTKNFDKHKAVSDSQEGLRKEKEILRKRVKSFIRKKRIIEVQKLVKNEEVTPWGRDTQAKLGSRLIELLTETAYVQTPVNQSADSPPDVRPAFRHTFKTLAKDPGQKTWRKYGVIECDPLVLIGLDRTAKHMVIPYVPMLIPPKKWKGP